MKRSLIYLLVLLGVLVFFALLKSEYGIEARRPAKDQAHLAALMSNRRPARANTKKLRNKRVDPFLKWGLAVPLEAAPYLESAIRCAEIVEIEKRRLSSGNRVTLIEGIQQKLFLDDYAFAALATGLLNPELAEYAFSKVAAQLQTEVFLIPPKPGVTAMPPLEKKKTTTLHQHYSTFLSSKNPGYAHVLTAFADTSPKDVLASDLFKDVCLYVSLQTQLKDWRKEEQEINRDIFQYELDNAFDTSALVMATNSLNILMQQEESEALELQSAYRNIFAFRFRDRHGIDPEALIPKLDQLELRNSGPELRIPE